MMSTCALSCGACELPCADVLSSADCRGMRNVNNPCDTVLMKKNCRATCGHCDPRRVAVDAATGRAVKEEL